MPDGDMIVDITPKANGAAPPRPAFRSEADEDEDYGAKVRRRIGKEVSRRSEAEKRASYWERRANEAERLKRQAEEQLHSAHKTGLTFFEQTVNSDIESAETELAAAIEAGDAKAQATATRKMTLAGAKLREVERMKATQGPEPEDQPEPARQPAAQPQPQAPSFKPRTAQWFQDNPWYGKDEAKTKAAQALDRLLDAKGINPNEGDESEAEYFEHLDRMLGEQFPDDEELAPRTERRRAAEPDDEPPPRRNRDRDAAAVAPARAATSPRSPASGKVRLTADQVEAAKMMGISLEKYAESLQVMPPDRGRDRS